MKEVEKATEKDKIDTVQLLETEKIDEAMEYCFKTSDSIKLFADEVFMQTKESGNSFCRIEQGKIIECTTEETVFKDTFLFNNP